MKAAGEGGARNGRRFFKSAGDWRCDGSTSIAQQFLDLPDELLRPVGLGDETAVVRDLGGARLDLAGGHDELHMRPAVVDPARQLNPVECDRACGCR